LGERGMRSLAEKSIASIRALSILIGIIIGCILAYVYQLYLPTLFNEMNVASLVAFVAIPMLAGFIVGLLSPSTGMRDGLLVGLVTGLFNSVAATVKLIYRAELEWGKIFEFSLFAIMSVFIWVVLAAAVAELATRFYE
jgi:Na+/proline symporter